MEGVKARVTVTLRSNVLDPQGLAIESALKTLGFDTVSSVRQGKIFDIAFTHDDEERARSDLQAMGEKLLANTVIENYAVEMEPQPQAAAKKTVRR